MTTKITEFINTKRPWRWFVLSGIFFFAAFLHSTLLWLVVPGIACLIRGLSLPQKPLTAFYGILTALSLKAIGGLTWVMHAYPISWMGIDSVGLQLFIIAFYWLTSAVAIGLGATILVGFAFFIPKHRPLWLLIFPIVLTWAEICGSLFFSLYSIGPGIQPGIGFSFGYVGYALATNSLTLMISNLGGVYLLSFAAGILGTILYCLIWDRHSAETRIILLISISSFILLLGLGWTLQKTVSSDTQNSRSVIAVHTYLPAEVLVEKQAPLIRKRVMQEAVAEALKHGPDIIVLPELSNFQGSFASTNDLLAYLKENGSPLLIDSYTVTDTSGAKILQARTYDSKRETFYQTDKRYLVPQGEYLPYLVILIIKVLGQDEFLERYTANYVYRIGKKTEPASLPSDLPSVLFCFSSVEPTGVRKELAGRSTKLVVHPIAHGWFHEPHLLWLQLDLMLKTQAVWNDATIIKAANLAPPTMYRSDGSTTKGEQIAVGDNWKLYRYMVND